MTAEERRRDEIGRKIGGLLWVLVWLYPLIGPFRATFTGRVHPALPAAAGLILFVLLYVFVVIVAFGESATIRLRPRVVLLGVFTAIGVTLAVAYAGSDDNWLSVLLYVAVAGAAMIRPPGWFLAWLAGSIATMVGIGLARGLPLENLGEGAFSTLLAGLLVFVVRRMAILIDELRRTQADLSAAAVAQERLRFARDLHDLLGHTLSLMVVKSEVIRRLAEKDPAAAAREAGEVEQIGRRALVEVREAVTGYRRAFATELDGAREALAGAGIEVDIRTSGTPLPPPADDVLAWAVREGVTNVIRHSGASRCRIEVHRAGGRATLEVRDDGTGGEVALGNGLRGLAERLAAVGGELDVAPEPAGGWRLAAAVPVGAGGAAPA